MDKEWISKDRLSRAYVFGVDTFLHFAKQNADDINFISCPCVSCGNLKYHKIDRVRAHLFRYGMDKTYINWRWHGEQPGDNFSMHDSQQTMEEEDFLGEDLDDMVHAAYENADNPDEFIALLEDAERPLYPGCSKFTKLSAIVKLYNLKARHSWSNVSMKDLLTLLREMLPENNNLPDSDNDVKKSLVALGMKYEKIDACPNDCVLYRNELKDHVECPTCENSRWKVGRNGEVHNKIPAKVLWYFPPIPRFQRMFRNKKMSRELTWHADERVCDGNLRHPADAPSWKTVDHKWLDFASDSRNLRLALSADGINPYGNMSSQYSCWPVILITYNLPPWLCMKRKYMMLTMLISGPKQPGNDIDVYLAPLIEDLQSI